MRLLLACLAATIALPAQQTADPSATPQTDGTATVERKDQKDQESYNPASVKFIVGGIVPKEVPYQPLDQKELWKLYANENFGLNSGAYFRAFGSALPDHLDNRPAEWGQGTQGYMTRVGDRFARFTISSTIQYAGQSALGHDPRYVRCKCEGFWPRFGHASSLVFTTYNRDGRKVFNVMNFAGAFGGEYVGGLWNPAVDPVVRGYQGAAQQIAAGWIFNVLREFGPEMKRAFRFKR